MSNKDIKSIADGIGMKSEDVVFQPAPLKKTRKKAPVVPFEFRFVEWAEVTDNRPHLKADVSKWSSVDFSVYIVSLFEDLDATYIRQPRPSSRLQLNQVNDKLSKLLRIDPVPPKLLKEYIDFYFDHFILAVLQHNTNYWTIHKLSDAFHLTQFVKWKESHTTISNTRQPSKTDKQESSSLEKDMSVAAQLGDQALLVRFGFILTLNYLAGRCDIHDAENRVIDTAIRAIQKYPKWWKSISTATERYSPYPLWMPQQKLDPIIAKISLALKMKFTPINIRWSDTCSNMDFLRPNSKEIKH